MSILYIVGKSPLLRNEPMEVIRIVEIQTRKGVDVGMLLISNAVIGLTNKTFKEKLRILVEKGVKLYALKPDLDARGIMNIPGFVEPVGFEEFVDLVADGYEKIHSWT